MSAALSKVANWPTDHQWVAFVQSGIAHMYIITTNRAINAHYMTWALFYGVRLRVRLQCARMCLAYSCSAYPETRPSPTSTWDSCLIYDYGSSRLCPPARWRSRPYTRGELCADRLASLAPPPPPCRLRRWQTDGHCVPVNRLTDWPANWPPADRRWPVDCATVSTPNADRCCHFENTLTEWTRRRLVRY
jgi:hypothetical protein